MRRHELFAIGVLAMVGTSVASPPAEFEFSIRDACDLNEVAKGDKITLKRQADGLVIARVATMVNCATRLENPSVEFLNDEVVLRVDYVDPADGSLMACMCGEILTYKLLKPIGKGTKISFGGGSDEPHVRALAP